MRLFRYLKLLIITLVLCLGLASYADYATEAKLEYNKGVDFYQLGQFDKAIDCFKQATELDPNYIDAYYNMGALLEYLHQDDAALAAFKQIILRKPDDYESVYKAAEISKKLGDIDKAKMYLTLIPQDSLIGQRAKSFAQSLNIDNKSAESKNSNTDQGSNSMNNSNGVYGDIPSPTGVVTDKSGNLYVAGFSDNTIYKIGADNQKIVFIKDNKIDGPIGLAIDSENNIYIANYNKNNVLKVTSSGEISEIISNINNPYCMHITGNMLFISSQGDNSVIRYKLN